VATGTWSGLLTTIVRGEAGVPDRVAPPTGGKRGGVAAAKVVGSIIGSLDEAQGGIDGACAPGGAGAAVGD